MALYQILYWRNIPSQVKVWDDFDEFKFELPPRFAVRIDQVAQNPGLTTADDFLAHWKWSDEQEREGGAEEVAQIIKQEWEAAHPRRLPLSQNGKAESQSNFASSAWLACKI